MLLIPEAQDILNRITAKEIDVFTVGMFLYNNPNCMSYRVKFLEALYLDSCLTYELAILSDILDLESCDSDIENKIKAITTILTKQEILKIFHTTTGNITCNNLLAEIICNADYIDAVFCYLIKGFNIKSSDVNNLILKIIFAKIKKYTVDESGLEVSHDYNDYNRCIIPMQYLHKIGVLKPFIQLNNYAALKDIQDSHNHVWALTVMELCQESFIDKINITSSIQVDDPIAGGTTSIDDFDF